DSLIVKYGVHDCVILLYEKNLIDYVKNCKFLLRTNNEDGYGVSLQESIDLDVPAVATDVCVRPKGTILFRKNDLQDLCQKVDNIDQLSKNVKGEQTEYHLRLIELY